ncbi:MAG: phage integrase N-terminal SAM-like domain-containing protein, partial [Gammaproteobacteria bacterium]
KLLDEVRTVMRLKHYSIHTERTCCDWIKRYVKFHKMHDRSELLTNPESKVEAFLSDLAIRRNVAVSTQNQAMNALVFLYKQVLESTLQKTVNAGRSESGGGQTDHHNAGRHAALGG